jgi:hypothetical protein
MIVNGATLRINVGFGRPRLTLKFRCALPIDSIQLERAVSEQTAVPLI